MPQMDHTVKNMPQRTLIGFQKVFEARTAMQEIPKFWDEVWATYGANVFAGNPPATAQEKAFSDHEIGEFGVCVDDVGVGKLRYLIAGTYRGGDVPEGTVLYELPAGTWAVFDCNGPIPDSLQALTNWVYGQWLPGNPEFEIDGAADEDSDPQDALQDLAEDAAEKVEDVKEAVSDKVEDVKEVVSDKVEDVKDAVSDKVEDVREAVSDKVEDVKEVVSETVEDVKEAVSDKVEEVKDAAEEMLDDKE